MTILTIIIMLFASLGFADISQYHNWTGFEDARFEFSENTESQQLYEFSFLPDYYRIGFMTEFSSDNKFTNSGGSLKYEFTFFKQLDPNKEDLMTFTIGVDEISLYDYIKKQFGVEALNEGLCLKKLKVYMSVQTKKNFILEIYELGIKNLVWLNPPTLDYCELYLFFDKTKYNENDSIKIDLQMYYGYPSSEVDVYFVFYYQNEDRLFFFPEWTSTIDYATIYIPQFTYFIRSNIAQIRLPTKFVSKPGNYKSVILLFEHGTQNLITDSYAIRKFVYE